MAMPPPPPPFIPRKTKRKPTKLHPQALVTRFWSKYHTKTPGKVTSIFPRRLYKGLAPSTGGSQGDVHNAAQSYEAARVECEAMVRKAVARCEQTNSKFTDPDFDIETDHWLGEGNYLYGLDRGSPADSDSEDDDLSPQQMKKSFNNVMRSGILAPTTQLNTYQLQRYLGGDARSSSRRSCRSAPMSVHRLDWIFENPQFTINGYSSSDIKQGALGDCWWLVAVSNIAHRRDLMEKICVARDEECGVYGFVFHRDGAWIPTVVDDNLYLKNMDFGCDNEVYDSRGKKAQRWKKQKQTGSEALFFSRCEEENETWLPLLEKAYAKVHGDYDAIHGGWAGSGVEDLTGGVNNMILANRVLRKERLWKEMLQIDRERGEFVFGLSATSDFRDSAGRKNGIVQSHAYSVLRAVEVEGEGGKKHKLIKMRNPWGQRADNGMGEWHGPWSDGSKEWTPHMIHRLQHEPADDGVFWMAFDDVLSNFKWIHRTRLFDKRWTVAQKWTSEQISWVAGYLRIKFVVEVKRAGLAVIVLSKPDSRYFKGLEGIYCNYLEFVVRKPNSTEILAEARGFPHSDRRSVNCEIHLEPGVYEVYPKVTAERLVWQEAVERVVQREADRNPKKLRQIGMQYDVAHAKAGVLDEDAEQEKNKEKERQKQKKQKRKQDKMNQMRDAMAKMQLAMSEMTKQVNERNQKKDKDREKTTGKDKDRNQSDPQSEREDTHQNDDSELRDENVNSVSDNAKKTPASWLSNSAMATQVTGTGEGPSSAENRPDEKTKQTTSQSTQTCTRDAPVQTEPEPESAAGPQPGRPPVNEPVPVPEPTPDDDPSSSCGSDTSESESEMDSESDTSDASSISSLPPIDRNPPWNPVCIMCLRVYAQDKEVSVKLVGKNPAEGLEAETEVAKEKEKTNIEQELNERQKSKDQKGEQEEKNKDEESKKDLLTEIKETQEHWLRIIMASRENDS